MRCPRCGTNSESGASFCGVCGMRLARPSSNAGTARTPAQSNPASVLPGGSPAPVRSSPDTTETVRKRPMGNQAGMPRSVVPAPAPAPPANPYLPADLYGQDPYIGRSLNGRFAVEGKLGEGGFGAVYRGTQSATGRKVALKLLHPEMTRDQNVVERFRREGQVLCALRDAHTITTYDFDRTDDGTLFIAMELLEGRSLHDVFHDEAPIPWQRMLKIVAETCSSLHEAHGQGIVHRDLKPENIHLENRPGNPEFVKVLDFGIAKVLRGDGIAGLEGAPQLTATGQTLGTLEYMSPEQLMGKPLDGRSDVYGLGVVSYELITGQLPFPDAVGPAALISAQLKKVPPPASQVNPNGNIPAEVDAILARMLEKDKNQRFKDVAELRVACEQVLATTSRPFLAQPPQLIPPSSPDLHAPSSPSIAPPGSPLPAIAPGASGKTAPVDVPASTREALKASKKRGKAWIWIAAVMLIAVGGIVGSIIALR